MKHAKYLAALCLTVFLAGCSRESQEHREFAEKTGSEITWLAEGLGSDSGKLAACGHASESQDLKNGYIGLLQAVASARLEYLDSIGPRLQKTIADTGQSTESFRISHEKSKARVRQHQEALLASFKAKEELGGIEIRNYSPENRALACKLALSGYPQAKKALEFSLKDRAKYFSTSYVAEGSWDDS